MPKTIQNGGFQNPLGQLLTGNLLLVLSQDAKSAANPNQVAPIATRIAIASGNIAPTSIYFNDELLPNNTYYTMTAYDAAGNKVYGPEIVSFTGAGPLDLGTLTPLLISPDPLFSNPVLQNPVLSQTIVQPAATVFSVAGPGTMALTATDTGTQTISGNKTFTGALNANGVTTITQLDGCQHVNASQSFATALSNVASGGCLVIDTGTWPVSVNATSPAGVTLVFSPQGILSIATTVTLTINGPIQASNQQIFIYNGTGTVATGGAANPVQPIWFPGATADVQMNNACAALPGGGGVIDARGYGAGNRSIAASVVCGSNGKRVTWLFDPSTIFQPATSSVNMFLVSNENFYFYLHIDTTNQPTYTGFPITNNTAQGTALVQFRLDHTVVNMPGGTGTGNCLAWTATVPTAGVQNGEVNDFTCNGNVSSSAILISVSGSGYSNSVHYRAINCNNMKYCVDIEQAGTGSISANIFSDLFCEHNNLAGSLACVNINATGASNLVGQNQFYMNSWDLQGTNKAVIVTAGSNGHACGNLFQGQLQAFTDNSSSCAGGATGNIFIDLSGQQPSGYLFGQVPSIDVTKQIIIGPGAAITGSGAGGVALASPGGSNSSGGRQVETGRVAGCTTAASIGGICATPTTITWSGTFVNANYTVGCWAVGAPTGQPGPPYVTAGSQTTTGITVNYQAITAVAASWAQVDCVAIHD